MRNIVEYIFCVHTCSPRIILTDAWGTHIYRGPGSGRAVESLTMIMSSTGKNSKEHVPNLPFSPFFAVHLGFHISVFSVALSRLERYSKDAADFSKPGLTTNQIQMVILGQLLWVKPYLLTYNWVDNKVPRPSSWTLRWL